MVHIVMWRKISHSQRRYHIPAVIIAQSYIPQGKLN